MAPSSGQPHLASEADRAGLQDRTVRVLLRTQLVASAGLTTVVAVAVLGASELGAPDWLAAVAGVSLSLGSAVAAAGLSPLMDRRGRRVGLTVGYALAAVGAALAALTYNLGFLPGYFAGMALIGVGQASNLLARYAGADLADEERKATAISTIVWASTIGAVSGPLLLEPARALGRVLGLDPLSGPFVLSLAIWLFALASTQGLRPDPLLVARQLDDDPDEADAPKPSLAQSFAVIRQHRLALLGLTTLVVSQAVMVGVMQMTPLHLEGHDHGNQVGYVFATHIAGMYAFSPLVGRFSTRVGRRSTMAVGGGTLVAAGALAAVAGSALVPLYAALFLLGIGWNLGLVGGSAALTEGVPVRSRVGVQGVSDLLMTSSGVVGTLVAGIVNETSGFAVLSIGAAVLSGALAAAVWGLARDLGPAPTALVR